jgi:hypothetical protein
MKRTHIAALAALPILGLSFVGAGVASAHGPGSGFGFGGMMRPNFSAEDFAAHQTQMFAEQAELLGISVDEIKEAWAAGTSFKDLAEEKGITDEQIKAKMKAAADARIKAELSALVDKGIITQAQADKRYTTITAKMATMPEKQMMKHARGFGKKMQNKAAATNQ